MSILLSRDEFNTAIEEINNLLNNILQYQENFDNEIFSSLERIEQALIELKPCECEPIEVKKVIPKKK